MSTRFDDTDPNRRGVGLASASIASGATGRAPRTTKLRTVINAIFYLLQRGCRCRLLLTPPFAPPSRQQREKSVTQNESPFLYPASFFELNITNTITKRNRITVRVLEDRLARFYQWTALQVQARSMFYPGTWRGTLRGGNLRHIQAKKHTLLCPSTRAKTSARFEATADSATQIASFSQRSYSFAHLQRSFTTFSPL